MTRALAAIVAAAALALPAMAETAQPYAGQEAREIASLSPERIAGLRAAAGLGYAKSAELNGWPGPLHVLELAGALDLNDATIAAVKAIRADMAAEATALGEELIAAEAALDALFASGDPDADAVLAAAESSAAIEARLRAAHLKAHLRTTPLLTRHQRMIYARERGYGGGHGHGGGHGGQSHKHGSD